MIGDAVCIPAGKRRVIDLLDLNFKRIFIIALQGKIKILLASSPTTCFVLLGIFALLIGSFLNVVIYRLPFMLQSRWQEKTPKKPLNICFPRSFCPHCHTTIPCWHNIPLSSFLINRAQCFACHAPISKRYLIVELLTPAISLWIATQFGFSITLLYALLFTWIIICITCIDLEHQLIPDELSLGLLWLGLIANLSTTFTPLTDAVLGAICGYVGLWTFIKLYQLLTKKTAMGHGDFKLFAALGAWFGWTPLPMILFAASLLGAVIGIFYLIKTKQSKHTPIPFGPFLCLSGLIALQMHVY